MAEKSGYIEALKGYVSGYLIPKNMKSEEYYFGENNPLKTRLIADITYIRELAADVYRKNPRAKPRDVLPSIKIATENLKRTICEEFNVEGCAIGWQNVTNAACYVQWANADLYGKEKPAQDLRVRIDDIVTTDSTGFHYRDKKGIYYCIVLGYNIFAVDNLFTVEEAVAVLLHELGHAMQHLVSNLNISISTQVFETFLNYYEPYLYSLDYETQKTVSEYMRDYRRAVKKNDKAEMERLGKEILDSFSKRDGRGFSEYTDQYIEDEGARYAPSWDKDTSNKDSNRIKKEGKFNIFKLIKGILSITKSLIFGIFLIPAMIGMKSAMKNKNNEEHIYKVFEQAADNFCQIYGMGVYQATALRKLDKLTDSYTRDVPRFIERIPLLDLWTSFNELASDRSCCAAGYPTNKQRAINLYKAAEFELRNNKDLSEDAKKELRNQIENYKKIYEEFVNNDQTKGWFYKLICGVNRESIESAAKKDKYVEEQVLIPLQLKSDPKFNPEDAYKV